MPVAPAHRNRDELAECRTRTGSAGDRLHFPVPERLPVLQAQRGRGGNLVFASEQERVVEAKKPRRIRRPRMPKRTLASCLAEEGGKFGIRVNTVNAGRGAAGSAYWDSPMAAGTCGDVWRGSDQLRGVPQRTSWEVPISCRRIIELEAVAFSPRRRVPQETGNIINVDGGVAAAYPR